MASPPLSLMRVVKVLVPATVGVPVIVQLLLTVRPSGSVPLASAQLYGGRPAAGVHAPE